MKNSVIQTSTQTATGLVLAHGFTGDTHAWDDVIKSLSNNRKVTTLSLPGHATGSLVKFTNFFGACNAVLRNIPPWPPAHWVGYSLGARLLAGCATITAYRPASLTLIGFHPGLAIEATAERRERTFSDNTWCKLLREEGIQTFAEVWQKQPIFATQHDLPDAKRLAQHRIRLQHSAEQLARVLEATSLARMPDLRSDLGRLAIPIHLIVGDQDPKFVHLANNLTKQLPNGRVSLIKNCGHNPLLEAPGKLAALIQQLP